MSEVSIRDLRGHGGEVIDRVARGDAVTVTRQGRPVARLVPLDEPGTPRTRIAAGWRHLRSVDAGALRADIDRGVDQAW